MNFYKRYPGDYRKKTARLTLAQHGVYTLLLDEFYLTEQPLPADYEQLFRICTALKRDEQDAVRLVADRFFPIGEDGLRHNERAIEELEEAMPALEAARANGKKGGRPRKTETQQKPSGLFEENPVGFGNETQQKPSSKAPHSPDTPSSLRSEGERASDDPLRGVPDALLADYLKVRKAKRAGEFTPSAIALMQREADKAGITLVGAIEACIAYGWQGFNAGWYGERQRPPQPRASQSAANETPYQRSMRERMAEATGGHASRRAPGAPDPLNVIEGGSDAVAAISHD